MRGLCGATWGVYGSLRKGKNQEELCCSKIAFLLFTLVVCHIQQKSVFLPALLYSACHDRLSPQSSNYY